MNAFDTVDTAAALVSNQKSQDGSGDLTRLTDLTPNRRGCTCRASAGVRARRLRHLPFSWCQIRQIRETDAAVMRFHNSHRGENGCQFDTDAQSGGEP